MKAIVTGAISALMLTACADGYDKTAMPGASEAVRYASLSCETKWAVKEITSYSEMAACSLAAERKFFTAIKLKKMDKFEAYAARYQRLAAMRDTGRIVDSQASFQANKILRDFYTECGCAKQTVISSAYLPGLHVD